MNYFPPGAKSYYLPLFKIVAVILALPSVKYVKNVNLYDF